MTRAVFGRTIVASVTPFDENLDLDLARAGARRALRRGGSRLHRRVSHDRRVPDRLLR